MRRSNGSETDSYTEREGSFPEERICNLEVGAGQEIVEVRRRPRRTRGCGGRKRKEGSCWARWVCGQRWRTLVRNVAMRFAMFFHFGMSLRLP